MNVLRPWLAAFVLLGCNAKDTKATGDGAEASGAESELRCLEPGEVASVGSVVKADGPFPDCSKNLKIHCVDDHEGLCGYPLDAAGTEAERAKRPGVCCYRVPR